MMMDEQPATDTSNDELTGTGVKSRADAPDKTQSPGSGDDRSPIDGSPDNR